MDVWLFNIVKSTEFWAALLGALAAFMLEALRRWRADSSATRASINLSLSRLGQMYNVLRNYHCQAFVEARNQLLALLGHEPELFYYKPVFGIAEPDLSIPHEQLGVLLQSHDPDILSRIYNAERTYLSCIASIREHASLHRAFQERTAASGLAPLAKTPIAAIQAAVGFDLYKQVEDIARGLKERLPSDYDNILTIHLQLHEVAKAHFPTRKFLRILPTERSPITTIHRSRKPKVWRRFVRYLWTDMPIIWNEENPKP